MCQRFGPWNYWEQAEPLVSRALVEVCRSLGVYRGKQHWDLGLFLFVTLSPDHCEVSSFGPLLFHDVIFCLATVSKL